MAMPTEMTFRMSTLKVVGIIVGCAVFCWLGLTTEVKPDAALKYRLILPVLLPVMTAFFALGFFAGIIMLFHRPHVRLDRDGIEIRTLITTEYFRWLEVRAFRTIKLQKSIVIYLEPVSSPALPARPSIKQINKSLHKLPLMGKRQREAFLRKVVEFQKARNSSAEFEARKPASARGFGRRQEA
ncbi:MAG: PH domain-containing protein [Hyphomonadaceae bacterium]|nr:PH domain-containing protein [Hyphomonadaceae bacterium]